MQIIDWNITRLEQPTEFAGLGQLKQTTVPSGVEVLIQNNQILAIPGISGGDSTKVDVGTQDMIVEIANFPGQRISKSSQKLNYRSDGGRIWAGGIKQQRVNLALIQMRNILQENNIDFELTTLGRWQSPEYADDTPPILVDLGYIANKLDNQGINYWHPILLEKLEFLGSVKVYSSSDNLDIDAKVYLQPSVYYSYIEIQDDILTELIRLIGFDQLPRQDLTVAARILNTTDFDRYFALKQVVADHGFHEVITRPFVNALKLVGNVSNAVKILNPSNSTEPYLRDNLTLGLLQTLGNNLLKGEKNPHLFELNQINKLINQQIQPSLNLALVGVNVDPYFWTSVVFEIANIMLLGSNPAIDQLLTTLGQATRYSFGDIIIELTQISNKTKKDFDLPLNKDFWSLSIDLNNWQQLPKKYRSYQDISDYPVIRRSYTITIPNDRPWTSVVAVLESCSIPDCQITWSPQSRIKVDNQDKLTYSVEFVSYSRTLTSEDIDSWEKSVIANTL